MELSKTNNILIEKCNPQHYADVAKIYNEHIEQDNCTMDENNYDATGIAKWIENFNDRERLYVLSVNNIGVIGWGIIKRYTDREGYRAACETAIFLKQDELGKGYGTFFKKRIIQECKALGYHHLVAKIWASNTVSIEYNKKLGYEIVGIQKEIGYKNGKWIDIAIMQYIID